MFIAPVDAPMLAPPPMAPNEAAVNRVGGGGTETPVETLRATTAPLETYENRQGDTRSTYDGQTRPEPDPQELAGRAMVGAAMAEAENSKGDIGSNNA